MNELKVREIAIKRHDLDAGFFQKEYETAKDRFTDEFIYGRNLINEELELYVRSLPANAKILDIGCGTGHLANLLKTKGFDVVGLEPSEKMLEFAKSNFPDISFVQGISSSLPFDNNTFDFILSIEVVRYLHPQDIEKTYKEIYRVLRPGGSMFITHVNKWSTDFYLYFYHLKGLIKKAKNEDYQYCYFTTGRKELANIKSLGFKKAEAVGRMFGSIRVGFKFGKTIGRLWAKLLEKISRNQRFKTRPLLDLSGHLFLIAEK